MFVPCRIAEWFARVDCVRWTLAIGDWGFCPSKSNIFLGHSSWWTKQEHYVWTLRDYPWNGWGLNHHLWAFYFASAFWIEKLTMDRCCLLSEWQQTPWNISMLLCNYYCHPLFLQDEPQEQFCKWWYPKYLVLQVTFPKPTALSFGIRLWPLFLNYLGHLAKSED